VVMRIPLEEWSHIACTFDGKTLSAYRNGKRVDFINIEVPPEELSIQSNQDFHAGANPGRYGWDGLVDCVRVWGKRLVWEEVRSVMNNAHVTGDSELLGQWTCSEGAGLTCFDSSGMNNHATLEGGVVRVQCTRDFVPPIMTASEKHVDSLYLQLREWKIVFEKREGRQAKKADLLLAPAHIRRLAQRLGAMEI